jgi:DtxR family transcriptional regulator, Mn-dependent transcriptional regulator
VKDSFDERDEELLEALYVRNCEGKRFDRGGLDDFTVQLSNLQQAGALEERGDEARLTSVGITMGSLVVRRHRLAERLISDVFGADERLMHARACRFEHIIDKGLDESICTLLGHPTVCPHGKPIPRGLCCEAGATEVRNLVTTLARMRPGQRGSIAYLHSTEKGVLNKLMALGVVPGSSVEIIQSSPSYAFQAGESQFAVDRDIAASIFVRLSPDPAPKPRRRKARFRGGLDTSQA